MTIVTRRENGNVTEEIRVERSEYKGREYVNLRKWFLGDDGKFIPTKKGITFLASDLSAVLAELSEI